MLSYTLLIFDRGSLLLKTVINKILRHLPFNLSWSVELYGAHLWKGIIGNQRFWMERALLQSFVEKWKSVNKVVTLSDSEKKKRRRFFLFCFWSVSWSCSCCIVAKYWRCKYGEPLAFFVSWVLFVLSFNYSMSKERAKKRRWTSYYGQIVYTIHLLQGMITIYMQCINLQWIFCQEYARRRPSFIFNTSIPCFDQNEKISAVSSPLKRA